MQLHYKKIYKFSYVDAWISADMIKERFDTLVLKEGMEELFKFILSAVGS